MRESQATLPIDCFERFGADAYPLWLNPSSGPRAARLTHFGPGPAIQYQSSSCRLADIRSLLRRPLARVILGAGGSTG